MATEFKSVDISDTPELVRLAEEVRATREPRVLRRGGEDVAVLAPIPPASGRRAGRHRTAADYAAFRASAGSWKDVDVDRFLADNEASRNRSSRPRKATHATHPCESLLA
jgi:hypothetical protein